VSNRTDVGPLPDQVRVTGTLVPLGYVFAGHGIRTSSTPLLYVASTAP
jgi:hypothetical protein